jgi:phenylacetate-CoA ligase
MKAMSLTRHNIEVEQLRKLNSLLHQVLESNKFYQSKLTAIKEKLPFDNLNEFRVNVPFTTKHELVADQEAHPPYGTNLTFNREKYTRFCQTSATTGKPLRWLDNEESWQWMLDSWKEVFKAANVTKKDTIMFAFSFGPFLGFWLAFEAGAQIGALCLPGGGLSSKARLRMLLDNQATVICCTPTYALRLAEVAHEEQIDLSQSKVHSIIVAGEPGGSIPATKEQIEKVWPGAKVCDHHGMTEVGPVTFGCQESPGDLQVIESSYIAEVIDLKTNQAVTAGEQGELILTTLGRVGSPLIRYRTGDLVRCDYLQSPNPRWMILREGIQSRIDDMLTIRGINIFPAAIEKIIRANSEIVEYEVEVDLRKTLAELRLTIEPAVNVFDSKQLAKDIEHKLTELYAMRIPVKIAAPQSLPRYELKSRRWKKIVNKAS